MEPLFTVRRAGWAQDRIALQQVRRIVFIEEQSVPEALEWDALDAAAVHVLALDSGKHAIGTGRLVIEDADSRIGRMAVLPAWRGKGVGRALLQALLCAARDCGAPSVLIHAQMHALDFYSRQGFAAEGATFMEAGIAHQAMRRAL